VKGEEKHMKRGRRIRERMYRKECVKGEGKKCVKKKGRNMENYT
jgi:hypothetical protein